MRTLTTVILFTFSILISFSQKREIDNKIGDSEMIQLIRGSNVSYDFKKQTKGKVVIIEFWETWCGPCIDGMHHLKALKETYTDSLEIICVSKGSKEKTNKFISKHSFDFTFIYDSLEHLNNIFPHTSIPHTILINSEGQIVAETSPSYITHKTIEDLINEKTINLPKKYNGKSKKTDSETNNSLISFTIERHQLGEPETVKNNVKVRTVQILTGYSAEEFNDTSEITYSYDITGKNILMLYQYTYNNYPLSRFKFDKDIDYINSRKPNHLYNVHLSTSNFLGASKSLFRRQLNAAFDLSTDPKRMKMPILRITKIDTASTSFSYSPITMKTSSISSENNGNIELILKASNISTLEIARTIENQIKIPVIYDNSIKQRFDVNLKINEYNQDVDIWLEHYRNQGIIIEKDSAEIEIIKIKKGSL